MLSISRVLSFSKFLIILSWSTGSDGWLGLVAYSNLSSTKSDVSKQNGCSGSSKRYNALFNTVMSTRSVQSMFAEGTLILFLPYDVNATIRQYLLAIG